ncbi:MAG TPA: ATP synthase subunit C [Pelomicrobium sp.]|nr:ATP synthase subunit C [Pelomicrobium sp.]
MTWLIVLMGAAVVGIIGLGLVLELAHGRVRPAPAWIRGAVGANVLLFALALFGVLFLGAQEVMAQAAAPAGRVEVSVGLGLALIGIGIPTGLASIGAAIALGPVGSAALAVLAEKPEVFGRTLVYLGLAEGIAIYGLVVSILMLGKV